jgi:MoxR-like ATPase
VEGYSRAREAIAMTIVGHIEAVDLALTALLCEGHLLFEGVPGLGKTLLARSLAAVTGTSFSRIQFTPDLMPADVIGATMIARSDRDEFDLRFEPGPVFANVVLADEINRASPKTQSALLEAMQERAVTVRGQSRPLPRPFIVLATQNPLEMEGTYPLPEAQIDRFFFKVLVRQPGEEELVRILELTVGSPLPEPAGALKGDELLALQQAVRDVVAPPPVTRAASRIVLATQPERESAPERVRRFLRYGAGPRAAQSLVLAAKARALVSGRLSAAVEDLAPFVLPALRHRVALNFEGQSEGLTTDELVEEARAAASGPAFDGSILPGSK